jgi:hypothetical protein
MVIIAAMRQTEQRVWRGSDKLTNNEEHVESVDGPALTDGKSQSVARTGSLVHYRNLKDSRVLAVKLVPGDVSN